MKAFKKKMVLFTALAITAISATGITSASAIKKAGVSTCGKECINQWEYTSYADSYYYNDEHYHRSTVKVGGSYYYSGGYSGNYNARPGNWAYVAKYKSWYQGYNCYFDNKDCGGQVLMYTVARFI